MTPDWPLHLVEDFMAPGKRKRLSRNMSESDFVNGYWYAEEVKAFAKELGITPISKLRKDELEQLILEFLRTGVVKAPKRKTARSKSATGKPAPKDSDLGLHPDLPIVVYTNNAETKQFIAEQAQIIDPDFKAKSGAMYRLNRWREEQVALDSGVTYGELAAHYVELCQTKGAFPQAPSGRYINFLSNFLKDQPEADRDTALQAWAELKTLPIPKTYAAWKKHQDKG